MRRNSRQSEGERKLFEPEMGFIRSGNDIRNKRCVDVQWIFNFQLVSCCVTQHAQTLFTSLLCSLTFLRLMTRDCIRHSFQLHSFRLPNGVWVCVCVWARLVLSLHIFHFVQFTRICHKIENVFEFDCSKECVCVCVCVQFISSLMSNETNILASPNDHIKCNISQRERNEKRKIPFWFHGKNAKLHLRRVATAMHMIAMRCTSLQ